MLAMFEAREKLGRLLDQREQGAVYRRVQNLGISLSAQVQQQLPALNWLGQLVCEFRHVVVPDQVQDSDSAQILVRIKRYLEVPNFPTLLLKESLNADRQFVQDFA